MLITATINKNTIGFADGVVRHSGNLLLSVAFSAGGMSDNRFMVSFDHHFLWLESL
jgi:hypothetical protein